MFLQKGNAVVTLAIDPSRVTLHPGGWGIGAHGVTRPTNAAWRIGRAGSPLHAGWGTLGFGVDEQGANCAPSLQPKAPPVQPAARQSTRPVARARLFEKQQNNKNTL